MWPINPMQGGCSNIAGRKRLGDSYTCQTSSSSCKKDELLAGAMCSWVHSWLKLLGAEAPVWDLSHTTHGSEKLLGEWKRRVQGLLLWEFQALVHE